VPFRPAPVPTVLAAVGLVILVNLGLWQLRRHEEATTRLELLHDRRAGPPATAADLAAPPAELAWRDAVLTGHYTGQAPFLVAGRFDAGQHGYDVVEPFAVDGGPVLLVDRGFVPADAWEAEQDGLRVTGTVTIAGLLLPVEGRTDVRPLPAAGGRPERWPLETETHVGCETPVGPPFATIAARAGTTAGVYLTLGPELQAGRSRPLTPLPRSGYHAEPHHIGHLEYAIQWFLIAATLVGVWVVTGVQRGRRLAAGG
jgi:surfeit locus 1 family protein